MPQNKLKIIFITGESSQGKTYLSKKLGEEFGMTVIDSDEWIKGTGMDRDKINRKRQDILLKAKRTPIMIIEGIHVAVKQYRKEIRQILKTTESILVKIESPNYQNYFKSKYQDQSKDLKKTQARINKIFNRLYQPKNTKIIQDYEGLRDIFIQYNDASK